MDEMIVPIPIRVDLTIYLQGLPLALSEEEADKIARVVKAHVSSKDQKRKAPEGV